MTNCSYDEIYINKSSKNIGTMLDYAVNIQGYSGTDYLRMFINSGIASEIENGNPKFLVGMSGIELCHEVIAMVSGKVPEPIGYFAIDRSPEYWTGWTMAFYQRYSNLSFNSILSVVSFDDFMNLYPILHEADVKKCCEVLDKHFETKEIQLKTIRKKCGLTQEQLAELSGVSINTIRAYERKGKDISKAQIDILLSLIRVLRCRIEDLL